MSGRRTLFPRPSHPILATAHHSSSAKATTVAVPTLVLDTPGPATLTDVSISNYTRLHSLTLVGDFNPYRLGVTDFYGKGKTVDTSKPFTVVTQFIGSGSNLSEIKRFYVQGGTVIANPEPKTAGIKGNSITQEWCDAENAANKEEVYPFKDHGGKYFVQRIPPIPYIY